MIESIAGPRMGSVVQKAAVVVLWRQPWQVAERVILPADLA